MRRTTRALAALLAGLTLAACGDGSDTADSTTDTTTDSTTTTSTASTASTSTTSTSTASTSTTTPAGTSAPTTAAATTTPDTTTPDTTASTSTTTAAPATTEVAPGSDDGCLVGEWVVTEAEMNAFYDAVEALVDQPIDFTITGETGLVFTDATYAWSPAFTLELEISGITGTGTAGGSITGTYTTDDGVLSTELGTSELTLTVEVAGQTIDGATLGNGFITSVPFVNSPYTCDGPTPVIEFETIDARHPVTLTPAG